MRPILVGLFVSFSLLAQNAVDYSISGVVLNAVTGEPVKYALVTLTGLRNIEPGRAADRTKPQRPLQKAVQTGIAGEFQFYGLAEAYYNLTAEKPGFNIRLSPDEAGFRQIELKGSLSGVQLKLAPLGVIEGKVLDQNDEPLRGVNIVALQVRILDGFRDTSSARSVATDDRGRYRFWNLAPGRYYIKAAGKSGGTYRYVGDGTPVYSSWQSFTPTYFGGGTTLDSATPVQIESGSKASADFRPNLEPAFKIRGTLAGASAGAVTFELLQGSEDVSASRTSFNTSTGRFEVQDVTPGDYRLRATQDGKMRGEALVTVNRSDVNGVSIALAPAVTMRSVTRVLGAPMKIREMPGFDRALAAAGATPETLPEDFDQVMEPACQVSLRGPEGGAKMPAAPRLGNARNQQDGEFVIGDFLPGSYRVSVQCNAGYPTSVLSAGVDLLANPNLLIQPGVPPAAIEILVKSGGGTLNGELAVHPSAQGAGVLLVPAFSNSAGPLMIPIYGNSGETTQFTRPFLAPGDYAAYAFADYQQVEFRNPTFLQSLSGGINVRIEDGKEQQITIRTLTK